MNASEASVVSWRDCEQHAAMIEAEGRQAWRASERADLLDEQRRYWVEATHRLMDIISGLTPVDGGYTTSRGLVTPRQVVDEAQAVVSTASRSCRAAESRHRKRAAAVADGGSPR